MILQNEPKLEPANPFNTNDKRENTGFCHPPKTNPNCAKYALEFGNLPLIWSKTVCSQEKSGCKKMRCAPSPN
jgi:hypothetical protein